MFSFSHGVIGGGTGGWGQRGQLPPLYIQTREGNRYQMPPPFRRLSGMKPASTEKTQAYVGENVCEYTTKNA